jgi:hypothetical protein
MLDGTTPTALPAHDLGGRLLELVQEARDSGLDPEQELREAVARLIASTPLDQRGSSQHFDG